MLYLQIHQEILKAAQDLVTSKEKELQEQFGLMEQQLSITLVGTGGIPSKVLRKEDEERLLALLLVVPHGVAKMSHAVPGT